MRLKTIFSLDLRSIALFRIGLGFLICLDLFNRSFDLTAFNTDYGIMPRDFLIQHMIGPYEYSFHLYSGALGGQILLFLVAAAFAVCLMLGIHARIAAFASWVLAISLQIRNPIVAHSADGLLKQLLFWSMFLPLTAKQGKTQKENSYFSIAAIGITLQLIYVYVFTGILKLSNPLWQQGLALNNIMRFHLVTTFVAGFLVQSPYLLRMIAYGTLVLEIGAPFLLLIPYFRERLRLFTVILFVAFHIGLATTVKVGWYPLVVISAWLVILPSLFWESEIGRNYFQPMIRWFSRFERKFEFKPSWIQIRVRQLYLSSTIVYVFLWCLGTVPGAPNVISNPVAKGLGYMLGYGQYWSMFAIPNTADGFFVIPAILADGREVDLFRKGTPVSWQPPESASSEFPDDRWRKYMLNLLEPSNRSALLPYGSYLCRTWNEDHQDGDTLETFQIIYDQELFTESEKGYRKLVLLDYQCFDGTVLKYPHKYHSD